MSEPKPKIAALTPAVLDLEPGTYWWCRCGESENQPFCDSSHREKGIFSPLEFEVTESKRFRLCRCKHTKTEPYCDNAHRELRDK